ncbi:hypothetical protein lerEdw1_020734, partial [Lerista edwardsae]
MFNRGSPAEEHTSPAGEGRSGIMDIPPANVEPAQQHGQDPRGIATQEHITAQHISRKHNMPPVTPMTVLMFLFLLQLPRIICQNQDHGCVWRPRPQTRIYGSPNDLFVAEFVSLFLPIWDEFQFNTIPPLLLNGYFVPNNYHHVLAFWFAMNEIDRNPNLLPNNSLSYTFYLTAFNAKGSCSGTMEVLFWRLQSPLNYNCGRKDKLRAIIGGLTTYNSRQMPQILNLYKLSQ